MAGQLSLLSKLRKMIRYTLIDNFLIGMGFGIGSFLAFVFFDQKPFR